MGHLQEAEVFRGLGCVEGLESLQGTRESLMDGIKEVYRRHKGMETLLGGKEGLEGNESLEEAGGLGSLEEARGDGISTAGYRGQKVFRRLVGMACLQEARRNGRSKIGCRG